jgi:hypothetical protein
MGFLDDIIAQQSGGGMLGGLPASWESLTPEQKQMMAIVGAQDAQGAAPAPWPNQVPTAPGAAPAPPISTDNLNTLANYSAGATPAAAFPTGGAAPIAGLLPPVPAFGAGATPTLFANPAGSTPGNPALPAPPMAKPPIVAADDGEEDAPAAPAANAPASPLSIGGYQMPRVGTAAAFAPSPAALPANAQPTQGQLPVAPSVGDKLMTGYQNLHHGGGLIGSIAAAITGKRNDPAGVALDQQSQVANMTARALINRGVPQDVAIAAVQPGNTEMLKTLITQAFTQGTHTQETDKDGNVWDVNKQTGQKTLALAAKDDKFQHFTTKNFDGSETPHVFNTKTGEDKAGNGGGSGAGPAFGGILAPGVTYDPNKSGEDYLAQFSPEVQSATKAYINGDVMPTGNARKNSIATYAKTVAQKYGQDMGIPVSDSTYAAKRKMQTDLASSGNSTMGGILSNGESSFKHLAEYTVSAADQGNASHNFIGGGMLAHAQNYIGNSGGGSDTFGKLKAINDNLGKYGAESTKFYAGTGGGVEERLNALKEMNATTTSGEEAAAYAEKEKNLMLDRLNTKFQEIRNTLGEERGNAEIAKHMPDIQKNIAKIDANIAKLRGKEAPAAIDAPAAVPLLKVGESATIGNVSIKKVSDK